MSDLVWRILSAMRHNLFWPDNRDLLRKINDVICKLIKNRQNIGVCEIYMKDGEIFSKFIENYEASVLIVMSESPDFEMIKSIKYGDRNGYTSSAVFEHDQIAVLR